MTKKALCLILARSGSQRLKNKNMRHLYGKPLIYYSLRAVKEAKIFDKIIISTDSQKIGNYAKKNGIEFPFLRPKHLATKNANIKDVVKHALNWVKKKYGKYKYVQYVFPTSPLRNKHDILRGYNTLVKNKKIELVMSVSETRKSSLTTNILPKNKSLKNFILKKYRPENKIKIPKTYVIDGSIYIGKWNIWYHKKDWFKAYSKAIITPEERSVDIDNESDWYLAKYKFKNLKKKF
tara:strand:- start:245 stop:952 length:708 start_codon:yes stop_codon:yes gene_type:complete